MKANLLEHAAKSDKRRVTKLLKCSRQLAVDGKQPTHLPQLVAFYSRFQFIIRTRYAQITTAISIKKKTSKTKKQKTNKNLTNFCFIQEHSVKFGQNWIIPQRNKNIAQNCVDSVGNGQINLVVLPRSRAQCWTVWKKNCYHKLRYSVSLVC